MSAVTVEDNGAQFQSHALAHQETGTDSHALLVPLANNGTHQLCHVHAHPTLSGMVLNAEHAPVETDTGAINLTTVSAELETGTEPLVLSAQPTPTGTEEPALLVMAAESGTHWT